MRASIAGFHTAVGLSQYATAPVWWDQIGVRLLGLTPMWSCMKESGRKVDDKAGYISPEINFPRYVKLKLRRI